MLTSGDESHGLTYAVVGWTRSSQPKLQYKLEGGGVVRRVLSRPLVEELLAVGNH